MLSHMCLSVMLTESLDLDFLVCGFIFRIFSVGLYVKVTSLKSRSQEKVKLSEVEFSTKHIIGHIGDGFLWIK